MDAPIRDPESSNLTPSEQAQFSSEKLPSIEDTLQMARLANMVYEERPIAAFKEAAKALKDDEDPANKYKKRLVDEGGADTEMWYYECKTEGTEAILTFSATKNRCTVVFRGTEVGGEGTDALWASLKDIGADLSGLKKPFGPNKEEDDHPAYHCRVHQGFRTQYYGRVSEFRNDLTVDGSGVEADLLAEKGTIKDMVLETALLQKVRRCI